MLGCWRICSVSFGVGGCASKPGLVPADELLSFAPPKESNPRKGGPAKRPTASRKRMDASGKRNQLATLKHVSLLYPLESILLRRFAKGLKSTANPNPKPTEYGDNIQVFLLLAVPLETLPTK